MAPLHHAHAGAQIVLSTAVDLAVKPLELTDSAPGEVAGMPPPR